MTETNHEILRHLESCPACRADLEGRRRVRGALQGAFERAPELQPAPDFQHRLRDHLRGAGEIRPRSSTPTRRWLALAAGLAIGASLVTLLFLNRSSSAAESLARAAVGDHTHCALEVRQHTPMPLEEAARRFDSAYRLLLTAPPDDFSAPGGIARVVERHSCIYDGRRFGHVVFRYRGHVVSLLVTTDDGAGLAGGSNAVPRSIGPPMHGLSVISVDSGKHAILMVGDLERAELTQLSRAVSVPLAARLAISQVADVTLAPPYEPAR